ncbi:MAG TPA: hypothetical protein VLR27_06645 [Acidimicrobiales bacterium]|nr:hypothetical protein [Acidimicrobiales bacterium]
MTIALTIAAVVLLTAVMLLVARAGGRKHQEDLSGHGSSVAGSDEHGRPAQPKSDRPAGPDAEAMGVSDAGQPSVDPTSER